MATQIYKVQDPSGQIREIEGPSGASDEEIITQAQKLFSVPAQPSEVPAPRRQAGSLSHLGRAAASLADVTIGGVAPAIVQQLAYPIARAVGQSAPEASATAGRLGGYVGQPFGRALGVTETPEYQQEATRRLFDFIGQNIQKGTQWLAKNTGLPATDIENMIGSLSLGAPKAIGAAARVVPEVKQRVGLAAEQVGQTISKPFEPQIQAKRQQQSLEDYARGPQIDAASQAQRLKIAIDPTAIQPSAGTKVMSMVASGRLNDALVAVNRNRVRDIALSEMGMPATAQLNGPAAFNAARANVAAPYDKIKKLPIQQADDTIIASLDAIRPPSSMIGKDSSASTINSLVDQAIEKTRGGLTGEELLNNIRSLRTDAQRLYKNKNATPAQIDVADANLAIASQLEAMIESNIFDPRLLSQFREARQNMARIYAYEGATDMNTGIVDVGKLSRITSKDNALTGDIAALGQIAGNFPDAFSSSPYTFAKRVIPPISRASIGGALGAAAGSPFGIEATLLGMGVGGALGEGLGAVTARRVASPEYQQGLTLRDRRVPLNQLIQSQNVNKLAP